MSAVSNAFKLVPETCPFVDKACDGANKEISDIIYAEFEDIAESVRDYDPELAAMISETGSKILSLIEKEFELAVEKVKVQTSKLRDALIETCEEVIDRDNKIEELEDDIDAHEETIKDLRTEIALFNL